MTDGPVMVTGAVAGGGGREEERRRRAWRLAVARPLPPTMALQASTITYIVVSQRAGFYLLPFPDQCVIVSQHPYS